MRSTGAEIYFVNYKNSLKGTGGVGTVSRDMAEYYPGVHFVYWDGSSQPRPGDLAIRIPRTLHSTLHSTYAKDYLWPLLHGLDASIGASRLDYLHPQINRVYNKISKLLVDFANASRRVYWINDYTSIPLVGHLRSADPGAVIVFSFRTPFGRNGSYPKFSAFDVAMFSKLLDSDYITFHRAIDMKMFVDFLGDKLDENVDSIQCKQMSATVNTRSNRQLLLKVVPMGNNRQYRQKLTLTSEAQSFMQRLKAQHDGLFVISAVSRFERSKGLEYELACLDELLREYPEVREKFVFVRYSYISKNKQGSQHYNQLEKSVTKKIDSINNRYGTKNWQPIDSNLHRKLSDKEMTGLFMASDAFMVGSIADGFNHTVLEALYSRGPFEPFTLLLSDIGVTDYLSGYKPLTHNIHEDASALRDAIVGNKLLARLRHLRAFFSARRLSSRRWMSEILNTARRMEGRKR